LSLDRDLQENGARAFLPLIFCISSWQAETWKGETRWGQRDSLPGVWLSPTSLSSSPKTRPTGLYHRQMNVFLILSKNSQSRDLALELEYQVYLHHQSLFFFAVLGIELRASCF
jgi:hypothetical protein